MALDYQEILNQLPIIVYVNEADISQTKFLNSCWFETMGVSMDEVKLGWAHLIHPEDLQRIRAELAKASEDVTPYSIEYRMFVRPTNEFRWFLSQCKPIFDENNNVEGWVGSTTDITELKNRAELNTRNHRKDVDNHVTRIRDLERSIKEQK